MPFTFNFLISFTFLDIRRNKPILNSRQIKFESKSKDKTKKMRRIKKNNWKKEKQLKWVKHKQK